MIDWKRLAMCAPWLLVLFSLELGGGGTGAAENNGPPELWLALGAERLASNDPGEAILTLQSAVLGGFESPRLRLWLATAFLGLNRLDEASSYYREALEKEPLGKPGVAQQAAIMRHLPRLLQVEAEPFELQSTVAIHHPTEPLIAYHLLWRDDVEEPDDHRPVDHEVVWVGYDAVSGDPTTLHVWNRGSILSAPVGSGDGLRPVINVEWGKHDSLPAAWRALTLPDGGRLIDAVRDDFMRLAREPDRGDPQRPAFHGDWDQFTRFEKQVPIPAGRFVMAVSRWNNAALDQMLQDNFQPVAEWPDDPSLSNSWSAQQDRRLGLTGDRLMDRAERVAVRERVGGSSGGRISAAKPENADNLQLPPKTAFDAATPRYPNLWFYGSRERFPGYQDLIDFIRSKLRLAGFKPDEVDLSEGADLALSVEHLQPWSELRVLRHAHALHIRLFWRKLALEGKERVDLEVPKTRGAFWRVAASVHYEVEHSNPLHASLDVCPVCGRTGYYAAKEGSMVSWVHDPLGLELVVWGQIRGTDVERANGENLSGLAGDLSLGSDRIRLFAPIRSDWNTGAIAVLFID